MEKKQNQRKRIVTATVLGLKYSAVTSNLAECLFNLQSFGRGNVQNVTIHWLP